MTLLSQRVSGFLHARLRPRFVAGDGSRTLALVEAGLIGLVSGLAAVALKFGAGGLGSYRLVPVVEGNWPVWVVLPVVGFLGCALAGWLVRRFGPETSGSGVPQVKAALSYAPIALNARVAIVKTASTILALASGLTLGRQGPTVQVGAALAAQLSQWIPTSPDYRRQMISAGAAAGLAAGFNAPIAGVLFVVEELLRDVSGLTLGPAILASFVGAVVSRLLGGHVLPEAVLNVEGAATTFTARDLPGYLVVGLLAGVLGALFNRGAIASLSWQKRWKVGLPLSMGLAGALSGLTLSLLPAGFQNHSLLRETLISGDGGWGVKAIALATYFGLTLLAFGSGAPGGLFAPSLSMGASLGYLVSYGNEWLLGIPSSPTYALAGMGAFFCAISRVPVTAIVIVMEMTADVNLVLPLMIGSVMAYVVADRIDPGSLYQRLLAIRGIRVDSASPGDDRLAALTAGDAMHAPVETVAADATLGEALKTFARSHHRGFPVADSGRLVGMVTQADLTRASDRNLPPETPLAALMTPNPMAVQVTDSLARARYLFSRQRISRLPVMEGRRLVGILTRSDLLRVESAALGGEPQPHEVRQPSYPIYQTRSPSVGRGRILLPLANPFTAPALLHLALNLAHQRRWELECLHAIAVPRSAVPSETAVDAAASRRVMEAAARFGDAWQVPVHAQIRVTHDPAQTVLEILQDRHADLVLLGWKGHTSTPDRIFGDAIDTLIHQATCELMLVKWGEGVLQPLRSRRGVRWRDAAPSALPPLDKLRRWLVPVSGGPNVRRAVDWLPDLTSVCDAPQVSLCQVFRPDDPAPDTAALDRCLRRANQRLRQPAQAIPLQAPAPIPAIVEFADKGDCDAIVLGASREGLLQHALRGNIPEAIARQSPCTTILVRGPLEE